MILIEWFLTLCWICYLDLCIIFFPICMELGYISLRNSRTFFYILDRFMGFASFKMSPWVRLGNISFIFLQYLLTHIIQKSINLQYNTLGWWDKRLIDQASDVPSIFFFQKIFQNSLQKSLQLFTKIKSFECTKS